MVIRLVIQFLSNKRSSSASGSGIRHAPSSHIVIRRRSLNTKWDALVLPPPKKIEPGSLPPDFTGGGLPDLGDITYVTPEDYEHPRDVLQRDATPSDPAADSGVSGNDTATAAEQSAGDGGWGADALTTAQQSTDDADWGNGTTTTSQQSTDDGGWGNDPSAGFYQVSGADRERPSTYQEDTEIHEALVGLVEIEKLHKELRDRGINRPRASSPYSVPNQIADILKEGASTLARETNSILADRRRDPVAFKNDKKDKILRDKFKALVEHVYTRSDVIIATPYVANALVSQLKLFVALVWIDEAWRMPEPDALIALAGFDHALLRLQSGDAAQLPPYCATRDTHLSKDASRWWCNQFAPQLCKSLPERGVESGLHPFYLMENWRAPCPSARQMAVATAADA
ncbi:hypothetical protein DL769_004023 [Monosporascus sp. CRB-8-3]|nr:hypothetical protein DL769_004023 [Monosporascus sp. CRB-8-3]